jgi:hypothetical protein
VSSAPDPDVDPSILLGASLVLVIPLMLSGFSTTAELFPQLRPIITVACRLKHWYWMERYERGMP